MHAHDSTDHVEVDTLAGRVRGCWREPLRDGSRFRSAAFLGIPFAEAPVGGLRFAAPVPKAPWQGTRDALEFGATAQRGDPGVTLIPEPSVPGDSTLNLNVFTPNPQAAPRSNSDPRAATHQAPTSRSPYEQTSPTADGLPVLVWIHGGGYFAGSPASPWYDGRRFNRDGVVTVTVSYRLGFDGFGAIEGADSNRGVRDWLLALEWVQQNIAAFGGDPDRVTIAGQSAGGGAVLTLLGMPAAQHLFHGAYAMSAAVGDVSAGRAAALARGLAASAGVAATRDGFASVPEERLLELQRQATKLGPDSLGTILDEGLPLGPVIDGDLIVRPTRESLRAGVGADKPLVVGTTDDEFTMATTGAAKVLRWMPRGILYRKFGVPRARRRAYTAANAEVIALGKARLAGRVLTDRMFRTFALAVAGGRAAARGQSAADDRGAPAGEGTAPGRGAASTWLYRFAWPSGRFGFAEHCLDVPFFFDCLDGPAIEGLAGSNPPQTLADLVHGDAVRFIAEGDPGWPEYPPDGTARVYDDPSVDVADAYAAVTPLL